MEGMGREEQKGALASASTKPSPERPGAAREAGSWGQRRSLLALPAHGAAWAWWLGPFCHRPPQLIQIFPLSLAFLKKF